MPFLCNTVFKWPGWFFVSEMSAHGLSAVPKAGPRAALVLTPGGGPSFPGLCESALLTEC